MFSMSDSNIKLKNETFVQNIESRTRPKRKRGRPRKNQVNGVPKKRGRKSKNISHNNFRVLYFTTPKTKKNATKQ